MTQFPIGASITLANLEGDVHPHLHRLRASEPVSWLPALNAWVITRYDLAIAVMRDAKTFTVDHPGFSTAQVVGPSMLSLDGTAHSQHRSPFEAPFRKRAVEQRFHKSLDGQIKALIDGFAPHGQAELRRDYAGPIAVKAMIMALGLEEVPIETILSLYDTIVDAVTRVTAGEPVSTEGQQAFATLREKLLPSLESSQETSLLTTAAGMAQGLTNEQVVSNAAVLLFGGIETTEGMIANALYFLLTNPAALSAARHDPAFVAMVVEESLRMEPAAAVVDRYAVRDVHLGGAEIKADDLVQVSLAGANRDPAIFANPDHFDPSRANLRSHVAFAQGPHVCLGLHLARLEAQSAITHLLRRLPNFRLVNSMQASEDAKPHGLVFRKPQMLHVHWDL